MARGALHRPDLQVAIDRLHSTSGAKKSLRALGGELTESEIVEFVCPATVPVSVGEMSQYASGGFGEAGVGGAVVGNLVAYATSMKGANLVTGALCLTDSRLRFVIESTINRTRLDFPLPLVEAVQWEERMIQGTLSFFVEGTQYKFDTHKKDGAPFADRLRSVLRQLRLGPAAQPSALPQAAQQAAAAVPPAVGEVRRPPQPRPTVGPPQNQPAQAGPWPPHPRPVVASLQHQPPQRSPQRPPPAPPPTAGPPPGWYLNPENPAQRRWWDGRRWTEHIQ